MFFIPMMNKVLLETIIVRGDCRGTVMEKLFYKLIFDKRIKRCLSILEILYKAPHEVDIKKLQNVLDISKRTVVTTLEFTNTLLPFYASIVFSENGVTLKNGTSQPIEVAVIEIAKNTISHRILEHAFYDGNMNVQDLANKLFISESALRVRLAHMNTVLRDFDIQLTYYDVKLKGDEANIRYFYYTYFSEFQELFNTVWDEKIDYCLDIYTNIKELTIESNTKLLNYSYPQIVRWLFVTRDRMEIGRYVELKKPLINRIKKRESYKKFKRVYEKGIVEHLSNQEIPESEIVWAYIVRLNPIVYLNDNSGRELYRDEANNKRLDKKINKILKDMFDLLNIDSCYRKDFFTTHKAYFINLSLLTEISSVFQRGSSAVTKHVQLNLNNIFTVWCDYLLSMEKEEFTCISNMNTIAAQLSMITSQFVNERIRKANKVFYTFEGEAGLAVYLEMISKSILPSGIEGVFIFNEVITQELVDYEKPDIIVCNYKMPEVISDCQILRMSFIPQRNEWDLLKDLLVNLDLKFYSILNNSESEQK